MRKRTAKNNKRYKKLKLQGKYRAIKYSNRKKTLNGGRGAVPAEPFHPPDQLRGPAAEPQAYPILPPDQPLFPAPAPAAEPQAYPILPPDQPLFGRRRRGVKRSKKEAFPPPFSDTASSSAIDNNENVYSEPGSKRLRLRGGNKTKKIRSRKMLY